MVPRGNSLLIILKKAPARGQRFFFKGVRHPQAFSTLIRCWYITLDIRRWNDRVCLRKASPGRCRTCASDHEAEVRVPTTRSSVTFAVHNVNKKKKNKTKKWSNKQTKRERKTEIWKYPEGGGGLMIYWLISVSRKTVDTN